MCFTCSITSLTCRLRQAASKMSSQVRCSRTCMARSGFLRKWRAAAFLSAKHPGCGIYESSTANFCKRTPQKYFKDMQVWPFVANGKGLSAIVACSTLPKISRKAYLIQAKFYALLILTTVLPLLVIVSHLQRRRKILFLSQRFTLLYIYRISIYIDSQHQ